MTPRTDYRMNHNIKNETETLGPFNTEEINGKSDKQVIGKLGLRKGIRGWLCFGSSAGSALKHSVCSGNLALTCDWGQLSVDTPAPQGTSCHFVRQIKFLHFMSLLPIVCPLQTFTQVGVQRRVLAVSSWTGLAEGSELLSRVCSQPVWRSA